MSTNKGYYKFFLFLASGALFLLLASRSSFLYVFNNWDDANSYLSVGKALFNGKMPYRDVFDQKGMYLYFLYGIAYLISHTTFRGVYILELVLGFLDILGFYKILRLFVKEPLSVLFAPLSYLVIIVSNSFWWGGAAEEICLPCYVWGLYLIVRYFHNEYPDRTMSFKTVFCGGLLAGVIANIKFTGLGFFFAWMAMTFFAFVLCKEFVNGLKACIVFLFGMFLPFVPWLLYFGLQHSLYEYYWGYVYVNVFLYPNAIEGGAYGFVFTLAKILYNLILDNRVYFVFVIAGIIYSWFTCGKTVMSRILVTVLFGFMFLGIFSGGRTLPYYSLPLSVFGVLGFAFVGSILEKIIKAVCDIKKPVLFSAYALLTVAGMVFVLFTSMNIPFMSETKDSFFMFRFRDEVLSEENPTLLNVGALDVGLYTLTDIVPTCRWFQTQTLDVPEKENNPYAEQERYILEGATKFIIHVDDYPDYIFEQYELIDEAQYSHSGYDFTYYLFKRKY